ncbi:MAG: hypothetical protein DRJ56_08225 [Thermoprotei archaeon]|nr:MAG: hypothetical protein DRJ56_08225 [Thermoprotei archaeon]
MLLRGGRDLLYFKYDDIVVGNWISKLLSSLVSGISKLESKFMASVALRDFKNYLKVRERVLGDPDSDYKVQVIMSSYLDENPAALRSLLEDWLDYWVVKWRQRVRLAWRDDEELSRGQRAFVATKGIWSRLSRRRELKELVIGSLVSHGEVCFTDLVSESLIRGVLYRYVTSLRDDERVLSFVERSPVTLLNDALASVERVVKSRKPLVILRVNKQLFELYESGWERYSTFTDWP